MIPLVYEDHMADAAPDVSQSAASRFPGAVLPYLFLLFSLIGIVVLSIIMPPFQVADEHAHMQRADQISRGRVIAHRHGGWIDNSWVAFVDLYKNMWFHPAVKQTVPLAAKAGAIPWSGRRDFVNFQNTAQYGPALYVPQVVGIWFGRLADLTLAHTLLVARLINGFIACIIAFLALRICRRGQALMFATLLLPMTLSQFGSASQDALIISLSILAAALVSRALDEQRPARTWEFILFAAIVTATTMARPPQLALMFLAPGLLARNDPALKAKIRISIVVLIAVVVWMIILRRLVPNLEGGLSPPDQTRVLLGNPMLLATLIVNTMAMQGVGLMKTVVGCLGWLDTLMPDWYYLIAAAVLAAALIAPGNRGPMVWPATLALVAIASLFVVFCAALYISWTAVGKPTIDGLQGRYILPVLPLLAWVVPEYRERWQRALAFAWWPVVVFPILTLVVTPMVLMERYYGSWGVMWRSILALYLP